MKHSFWKRFRANRLAVILGALIVFFVLAFVDGEQTFSHITAFRSFLLPVWMSFGFSLTVALIFLTVGSLIWFYSHDRQVAFLLFAFSCAMMITFELETVSSGKLPATRLLETISTFATSFALILFAAILLVFPKNHLVLPNVTLSQQWVRSFWQSIRFSSIRWYILSLLFSFCLGVSYSFVEYMLYPQTLPDWIITIALIADVFALVGSLITIIISFRESTPREREQLRFFVSGVILAIAPLLFLTAIPQTNSVLFPYAIDAQITTLSVILLPLSLGYAILRYQILVLDSYIRRTVNWIIGTIFLAILVYAVAIVGGRAWGASVPFYVIVIAIAMAVLAPTIWWLAKILTERVLFKELLRYRRLIEEPIEEGNEVLDLEKAAQLITVAALQTFKTMQIDLFVLIEDTGCYHIFPPVTDKQNDVPRRVLMDLLTAKLTSASFAGTDALALQTNVEERLSASNRPLLLHEVIRAEKDMPIGLGRYLTSVDPTEQNDPMLVPIRSQGKMIGLLVLGERADQQSYAGPDFEIVQLLLARYSYLLETARLQERSRTHAVLLNDLYKTSTMSASEWPNLATVSAFFATIAAEAMNAGVEMCLFDTAGQNLQRTTFAGPGTQLPFSQHSKMLPEDRLPYFYTGQKVYPRGEGSIAIPPCLDTKPAFPFAWLPLSKGEKQLGMLIVTYPRPHLFFQEEIHVLEMFASQCAATLENIGITIELRAAYERQKELDALKDQFIMTASHELRTPLTAVLGYIELLEEYNVTLNADTRAEFIAKAHRGCDELTLMVNNIMDANRVQVDAENTKMSPVLLVESALHIVEIMEAMSKREQRTVSIAIPPTLSVMADPIRLRQVLLNLVSNALKYSPHGTNIEISAKSDAEYITVCVRDYGSGVPLEEQNRLFERFVRLERDMNSPTRGAGLGLFICKQLIEAMGGTIWVESSGQEGEGSFFFFTLRCAVLDLQADMQLLQNLSLR